MSSNFQEVLSTLNRDLTQFNRESNSWLVFDEQFNHSGSVHHFFFITITIYIVRLFRKLNLIFDFLQDINFKRHVIEYEDYDRVGKLFLTKILS